MSKIRWGILGPGNIAHDFANGLLACADGELVAIASRDAARRAAFGDAYEIPAAMRFSTYEALAASPDVDAVYIGTPHPFHAEQAIMVMRHGKHVLTEKPAGMTAAEVQAQLDVAAQQGVFWMEAFMYRCHPQIARVLEIIRSGEIGRVIHISARLGFSVPFDASGRLFNKALGGGAILDVGCYPLSLVRLLAGAANGKPLCEPITLRGTGILCLTGADERAYATLTFDGGITADIATAVTLVMDRRAVILGDKGKITLADPFTPGQKRAPSDSPITISTEAGTREEMIRDAHTLYTLEANVACAAIRAGRTEAPAPAMTWADSLGNAQALDRWRRELGYVVAPEEPASPGRITRLIPQNLPKIPQRLVPGVALPVSSLIIGCDNKDDVGAGAIMWDAWAEAGGNAFDSAFVYGGGQHEKVLGQWIRARGVEKDIVVIAKGAHSPYCLPGAIAPQLAQSLERLQLSSVPIYIMHRDNEDVPVGEFVDAMAALKAKGLIGIWGGSNWTTKRFAAATDYAKAHGLAGPTILNNNLSLAEMVKPVWAGCISSHTDETIAYLKATNTMHVSWSSQARGYFLPAELRNRLPEDTAPETCFGGPRNAERRNRAEKLAAERGVSAHNIATAWVLAQPFPSFALVGPRSPGEIASTLPALNITLSPEDVAWLNLET